VRQPKFFIRRSTCTIILFSRNKNETAVTAADYIRFTKNAPGLCITKANAWADVDGNEVNVVAVSGNEPVQTDNVREMKQKFPELSDKEKESLKQYLDEKRLLSTFVKVVDAVYAAVDVRGRIYVKPQYSGCEAVIKDVLQNKFDYVSGTQNFGEELRLDVIFEAINELECVSFIQELKISTEDMKNVVTRGADLCPKENCLFYPGEIEVEIFAEI